MAIFNSKLLVYQRIMIMIWSICNSIIEHIWCMTRNSLVFVFWFIIFWFMMENPSINGLKLGYPQFRKARNSRISWDLMWEKQWFNKPLMTGNGKFIPPITMVMTVGWWVYDIVLPTWSTFAPHWSPIFVYQHHGAMEDRS